MTDVSSRESREETSGGGPRSRLRFVVGLVLLSGCLAVSLLLVLQHFDAAPLPGCGAASDCSAAAESAWGSVPWLEWPVSFLGFAYFQGLWAAWWNTGGQWSPLLRWTVRLGATVSITLTAVMFRDGYLCPYCLAVHLLNLGFLAGQEIPRRGRLSSSPSQLPSRRGHLSFAGTIVLTSLVLLLFQRQSTIASQQRIQQDLTTSIDQFSDALADEQAEPLVPPGRYVLGPEDARVHILVFSDYECPSCRKIDLQLQVTAARRRDISLSARHFPFCTDCNDHVPGTRHPSACRAARAAEAAGVVAGAEGFWEMHEWLFFKKGQFTEEELDEFLLAQEWSEEAFLAAMQSDNVLEAIRDDTQLADEIGLKYTPLVFLNGRQIEVGGTKQ